MTQVWAEGELPRKSENAGPHSRTVGDPAEWRLPNGGEGDPIRGDGLRAPVQLLISRHHPSG
jgi:hypothetical protein